MRRIPLILSILLIPLFVEAKVAFSERNIDWGAVAESDVEQRLEMAPGKMASMSVGKVDADIYETRTLTLESGVQIRVTEQLVEEQGVTNRVFKSGEQLFELSIVSDREHIKGVMEGLEEQGCRIIKRYGRYGTILRVLVPQQGIAQTDEIIAKLGAKGAKSATRSPVNFYVPLAIRPQPSQTPNDPLFSAQWALEKVGVIKAWEAGYLGYSNIPAAVYDTGCHLSHEDLQFNVHTRVSALNSDRDPEDHHGHGSHCLGIMGADSNNAKGIAGVGQVANLTSIRGPISYWQEGDSILDGFQYALDNGIKIVSCSFGSYGYDAAEESLISELGENGTLVVVAAGNDGNDNDRMGTYPAAFDCDNILTVIATNESDNPANVNENGWATSFGATTADIAAPGTDIVSCTKDSNQSYEAWSGTSMATPVVAACAAILWEQNPSWGPLDIKRRLMNTADRIPALIGLCQSGARINLERALDRTAGYVAVETLKQKCYDAGEKVELEIYSAAIDEVRISLYDRGDTLKESWAVKVESERFNWAYTTSPEMIARGWYFKIEGIKQGEKVDDVFAYSNRFRVKDPNHIESIQVMVAGESNGDGECMRVRDANDFRISFIASDAEYVSGTIEAYYEEDEEGPAGWYEDAMIFYGEEAKAGTRQEMQVSLKGKGWMNGQHYRVTIYDEDDPNIVGYSEEFIFERSNGSVFLLPGEPKERNNPSAGGTGAWKSEYRVGEEFRITARLPSTSLYWLYLVDEESNSIVLLKEVWINLADGGGNKNRQWHAFDLTIPDQFAGRKQLYIYFYDAFDDVMGDRTPYFDVLPREGEAAPSYDIIVGDKSGSQFLTNGQWTPAKVDGEWAMKACWVGPGEDGDFETIQNGPRKISFDVRDDEMGASRGTLELKCAPYPIMKDSHWETLAIWRANQYGWQHIEANDLPQGDNLVLRWTWQRDENDTWSENEPPLKVYIRNIQLADKLDPPQLKLDSSGNASISEMPLYPTNVHWTVDNSEPTKDSRRWMPVFDSAGVARSQAIKFERSVILKAKSFAPGCEPSDTVTKIRFAPVIAEDGAILLSSVADILAFSQEISGGNDFAGKTVRLQCDIDMKGFDYETAGGDAVTYVVYVDGDGNYKVSRKIVPFNGVFDGAGHAIHNLNILPHYGVEMEYGTLGFIGMLGHSGAIRNLRLVKPSANAVGHMTAAGLLVGYNQGKVENCQVYNGKLLVVGADYQNELIGKTEKDGGVEGSVDAKSKAVKVEEKDLPIYEPSGYPTGMEYPEIMEPSAPAPEFYYFRSGWNTNYYDNSQKFIVMAPMDDRLILKVPAVGDWRIYYTLDGSEPDDGAIRYEGEEIVIPGNCVIKAVTFADGYRKSEVAALTCEMDLSGLDKEERDRYTAKLTVIGGRKLRGKYWLEDFEVEADAPKEGMMFSHWKVIGPLALDDSKARHIIFKWWQAESAITLEAVYKPIPKIPKVLIK